MVTSTVCPRWTVAAAAVAVTRISGSVQGPVTPAAGGNVNSDWTGLGDGVLGRNRVGVGVGVAVVVGCVPAPATGLSLLPQAYETTSTTMATPTRTTARRRQ
jgi:hypothetical protein